MDIRITATASAYIDCANFEPGAITNNRCCRHDDDTAAATAAAKPSDKIITLGARFTKSLDYTSVNNNAAAINPDQSATSATASAAINPP